MNTRAAATTFLFLAAISMAQPVFAQAAFDVPPPPLATAENEDWYISGQPIALAGNIYYPSGPITHFVRSEMVASGMFERVPIYRKTTQEPGSIVYVPLPGGLVRPYERRRSGDLAGTSGSTVPGFPVILPAEQAMVSTSGPPTVPAVPAAVGTSGFVYGALDRALGAAVPVPAPTAAVPGTLPVPVGTAGADRRAATLLMAPLPPAPTRVETVQRPVGLNGVYLQFHDRRWFAAGPAVEFAADRFTQIGEHRGFPVYQQRGREDLIFVSHIAGTPDLVIPYRLR